MFHYRRKIQVGDLVLLYGGRERIEAVRVQVAQIVENKFGRFRHDDIIGNEYGAKVYAMATSGSATKSKRTGFVYLLRPTPELWRSGPISKQTQIIFNVDSSIACFRLGLKPGSVVFESGTGSGSMSLAISRCIFPSGHLHTFEFHEGRAISVRELFGKLGLSNLVTVHHRDVCTIGFGLDQGSADAGFLDLPCPWKAIESAWQTLKFDGVLCSFSPCIEQVQEACEAMRRLKFCDIHTFECLLRPFEFWRREVLFEEYKKPQPPKRRKTDEPTTTCATAPMIDAPAEAAEASAVETAVDQAISDDRVPEVSTEPAAEPTNRRKRSRGAAQSFSAQSASDDIQSFPIVIRPLAEIRGHTGFLTFARKSVSPATSSEQATSIQAEAAPAAQ